MDRRPHRSDDPQEQATRLANAMLEALETDDEYTDGMRAIAFVYPNTGRGGVGLHGVRYRGNVEAAVYDALQSLDALLQTIGKSLATFEIPPRGQG